MIGTRADYRDVDGCLEAGGLSGRAPALDRGRVKTLFAWGCVSDAGEADARRTGFSAFEGEDKELSSPDYRHERRDSEDLHCSFHVVCEYVQTHLGTHAWQCLGQEVRRSHPRFERAERMLGGLASYS